MKITLTEDAFNPNEYIIEYEVEEGAMFEPSQVLKDCRISSHCFDKEKVLTVVNIINQDYEKALKAKEVKIQQAKGYASELEALFPMLSFEVNPNV